MKKLLILAVALTLLLAGCSNAGETFSSSFQYEEYEIAADASSGQINIVSENNEPESTPKENSTISSVPAETKKENKDTTKTEPDKTKTITINGKIYTANFAKTTDKAIYVLKCERKTNVYYTEDRRLSLEYDYITDDLLYAKVDSAEESNNITKEKAKENANDFIKTQCDISDYAFQHIHIENDGYYIFYSKQIDGYHTSQTINVKVLSNGNIERYSHNKFVFENVNTDVKINLKELENKLAKKLKETYGKDIKYTATPGIIDLYNTGELVMEYSVQRVVENIVPDEQYKNYHKCYVSLNNDNVYVHSYEKM